MIFASDLFTDTDNAVLNTHPPSSGGSWTELVSGGSAAIIFSNVVLASSGSSVGLYVHSATPPSANYDIEATLGKFGSSLADEYYGVIGRAIDASNYYSFFYSGNAGGWRVEAVVGGSVVASDTVTASIGIGSYALKLSLNGTSIDGYVDGVLTCHTTNAGLSAAGKAGLMVFNVSAASPDAWLDTWSATEISGDSTPPTIASWATNAAGNRITGTLSESGCIPTSGTGGFTLAGTAATVSSWAISGTTITLTLSGTVQIADVVTISYDDALTTDDITDASANKLADISSASVTNNADGALPFITRLDARRV